MNLGEIYRTAVRMGIDSDPRGADGIARFLERQRKSFDEAPAHLKPLLDGESLTNPFSDTRIYVGEPAEEVAVLLAGIDMTIGGVLLADRLRDKGNRVDAILSHHPEGWGLTRGEEVMEGQADTWAQLGVPIQAGEMMIGQHMEELRRDMMPANCSIAIDAARLLGIPYLSAHTSTDNLAVQFLTELFLDRKPMLVGDIERVLMEIPEYRIAFQRGAGPCIGDCDPDARTGKVLVDMAGGAEGPCEVVGELARAGVGTIVCMHASKEWREKAALHHVHLVVAGHMSSDSLGVNLLLDELERHGVQAIPVSGLIRVHRDAGGRVLREEPGALPRLVE